MPDRKRPVIHSMEVATLEGVLRDVRKEYRALRKAATEAQTILLRDTPSEHRDRAWFAVTEILKEALDA